MGQDFAKKENAKYVETSAKTGMGIEDLLNIFIPSRVEYLKREAEVATQKAEAAQSHRRYII